MKYKVGDKVRVLKDKQVSCGSFSSKENLEYLIITRSDSSYSYDGYDKSDNKITSCSGCYKDEHLELLNNTKNTIMSNIIEFAKNLVLSKEEKLLRKHGLKDVNGQFTADAINLVTQKLVNYNQEYLIDIATKKDKEEDK